MKDTKTTTMTDITNEVEKETFETGTFQKGGDLDGNRLNLDLAITVLEQFCIKEGEESEHEVLQNIAIGLKKHGDKLIGESISGGYTNYAYKIHLGKDPSVAVFAKVGLPQAIWSMGVSNHEMGLERVYTEFDMLKRFARGDHGEKSPAPTPYLCIDAELDSPKLSEGQNEDLRRCILVTEWAKGSDEPLGRQFVDGHVDPRVLVKAAEILASIHTVTEFDPSMNRKFATSLAMIGKQFMEPVVMKILEAGNIPSMVDDPFIKFIHQDLGKEHFLQILAATSEAGEKLDLLNHGDAHAFNMLVEKSMKDEHGEMVQFGEVGSFFFCDWEQVSAGPIGRDIGTFISFPLIISLYHAAQGNEVAAKRVTDGILDTFWGAYSQALVGKNIIKDDGKQGTSPAAAVDLAKHFRQILGWYGMRAYIFYAFGERSEHLNRDGLSDECVHDISVRVGMMGIRMMEFAFLQKDVDDELSEGRGNIEEGRNSFNWPDRNSLEAIRHWFRNLVEQEQSELLEDYRVGQEIQSVMSTKQSNRHSFVVSESGDEITEESRFRRSLNF